MAGVWTDPVDRADGYVVGQTVWNQALGDTGNLQYLYESGRFKYKTAAQSFVSSTTYVDITATSGNLAFAIAANEIWEAEWRLYVTTEVAGGYKFQVTGPAAPTSVQLGGGYQSNDYDGTAGQVRGWVENFVVSTSFSVSLIAASGGAGNNANQRTGGVRIHGLIVNGANAGTITLQGAQNSASGTTTLTAGYIVARRLLSA